MVKIGTYGEVMMRLEAQDTLIAHANQYHALYTGTGINVMANLAQSGFKTSILTVVPTNHIGDAVLNHLRHLGINVDYVRKDKEHMGIYFLEKGHGLRPAEVTYMNREASSFNQTEINEQDMLAYLETVDAMLFCGISLLTSKKARENTLNLVRRAVSKSKEVYFDFNVRTSLISKEELINLRLVFQEICQASQVVFGSIYDIVNVLGFKSSNKATIITEFMKAYNIDWLASTTKSQINQQVTIQGHLTVNGKLINSEHWITQVVDNIGTGDMFSAGILRGRALQLKLEDTLTFATVNAALAYTINGDCYGADPHLVDKVIKNGNIGLIR